MAGPAHQAGDVHHAQRRGHHLLRPDKRRDRVKPCIRNWHDADVRFDGGERIVRDRRTGLRQGVEEGGLAHVRKAHQSELQHHRALLYGATPTRMRAGCGAYRLTYSSRIVRSPSRITR